MSDDLHRFLLSCKLSYKALFTWLNPYGYVSSRIVFPLFIALLFGSAAGNDRAAVEHSLLGGSLLAIALAAAFGMALSVGNERQFGTLATWVIAPQRIAVSLLGKASMHLLDGILGAVLTFAVSAAVFDLALNATICFSLLAVVASVLVSATGIGFVVAAAVFRWRDTFTPPNLAMHLLLVCSGAVVATSRLPFDLGAFPSVLPLHHATQAAVDVVDGAPIPVELLALEAATGLGWAAVGLFAIHVAIARARLRGTLDVS